MDNMKQGYLVHFGEISLKWKNRSFFEKKLLDNILLKYPLAKIERSYGRYLILNSDKKLENVLSNTFWISNWAKVYIFDLLPFDNLRKQLILLFKKELNNTDTITFKLEVKRSNKSYIPNSMEISRILWADVLKNIWWKVNLHNPQMIIYIEIDNKHIYVYFERNKGLWWLPIWSSGKIVSLLSWWIDSPVASWLMMKRWAEVVLLHGYNERLDSTGITKEKIIKLTEKLAVYQWKIKLILFPVADITRWILDNVPLDYRMLIFKILLFKVANLVAIDTWALAITSGDNVWQVASQTLENLNVIYHFAEKVVLPPLLGYDKQEIVDLAKKIWTYDISVNIKCEDVCSRLASKHPVTKPNIYKVNKIIEKFDDNLLNSCYSRAEIIQQMFKF